MQSPSRRERPAFTTPLNPLPRSASSPHRCSLSSLNAQAASTQPRNAPTRPPSPRLRNLAAAAAVALSTITAAAKPVSARPAEVCVATSVSDPRHERRVSRAVPTAVKLHPAPKTASKSPPAAKSSGGGHGLEGQSFAVAGTAALLASASAVAVTHPIDTLKTLRQARSQTGLEPTRLSLSGLYRGVLSNILKEAPNAAIYLASYEVFKSFLLTLPIFSAAPLAAMCLAGMLGDALGSIVRVPAEIVNKRLQLGLSSTWGSAIRDSFLSPTGTESTLASWEAVLWRDVPYGGLQIAGYEFVRLALANAGFTGLGFTIVAGAVAGLVAAVLTTPADVLVTRMSTQSPQCYLETKKYMRPVATFRRILQEEGFGALWAGALHRGLFYMPMIGIFFLGYESFKWMLVNPSIALAGAIGAIATCLPIARALMRSSLALWRRMSLRVAVVAMGSLLVFRERAHG